MKSTRERPKAARKAARTTPKSPPATPQEAVTYPPVTLMTIFSTWWPLAASWLFMGLEMPMVSAVIARLDDPRIHLAAYGGVVFPVALIIESPIIMLLAASTALSKDWASYKKMWRFMMWTSALLTVLHALLAFTPLYYSVIVATLRPPEEIIEPARLGLMLFLPFTWSIAYRRFHQGVIIRFGRSVEVSIGTFLRMLSIIAALVVGVRMGLPGIAVGGMAISVGVLVEAAYIGWRVRPVLRNALRGAPPVTPPLSWGAFYRFYIPLALTSLILLIVQPIGSAALSRMPNALESLAVWPVLSGFLFMLRSVGMAFNEVVVALLDRRGALKHLQRFNTLLVVGLTALLLLITLTPAAEFYFVRISGLESELAQLARTGLWLGLLWPALTVVQNFYQGIIVHGRRTRGVTESVVLFLVLSSIIMVWGVVSGRYTGLYIALGGFLAGSIVQVAWLYFRSRPLLRSTYASDARAAEELS